MSRLRRWEIMTRTSRLIRSLLYVLATLIALVIIAFIVWRVNLARDVNAKLASIRASGLPTSGEELNAYYRAVPDNENAALVMTQAFALMRNYPDSRSNETTYLTFLPRDQRLTSEQRKVFSGYIEMNADALAKMREAIKLPESRYPVDYAPGPATLLPHLSELHILAEVVRYESLLASESGDTTDTAAAIGNLVGMSQTLDQEPDLIAQLVRISLIAIAENSLEHCLNITNLNESELVGLATTFSGADKTNLMARALIGDCAINVPVFQLARSKSKSAAELVEGAQQVGGFSTSTLDPWLIREPRFFRLIGFWDRDFLFYLNAMETYIALDKFPAQKSLATAENFEKVDEIVARKHCYLSKLFLIAYSPAITKETSSVAYLRTSIAAIAVERFRLAHGRLPENLNELVPQFLSTVPDDPFDGQPLRYHRLAKGYVVYSVGADGHDDGGREKPIDWKSTDKTKYDITFIVER
jgi:hypothetical protein